MTSRRRPKTGDVIQVSLPDGTYAYGRVMRGGVGFYRLRTDEPSRPPIGSRDYEFVVGVYDDALRQWPVVGHDPPRDGEDVWAPPSYIENIRALGTFQIYHKGVLRPASKDEVRGLDAQGVYDHNHVIDRLVTHARPPTAADIVRAQQRRRQGDAQTSDAAERE
jgi:hypothetical protein